MSRRQTSHQKRERSRERRAIDRAILRCMRQLSFTVDMVNGLTTINRQDQVELIGLHLARQKV